MTPMSQTGIVDGGNPAVIFRDVGALKTNDRILSRSCFFSSEAKTKVKITLVLKILAFEIRIFVKQNWQFWKIYGRQRVKKTDNIF